MMPLPINTQDWCGLQWTKWVPLQSAAIRRAVTHRGPGVYRIRQEGGNSNCLTYIGQTGRDLRGRLQALARCVNGQECPYNDPHTAAPHLWLLRMLDNVQFECSGALVVTPRPEPPNTGKQIYRGTEDMLLWRHRVDINQSTVANYGRFYPGYGRPSNRQDGRIAAPLKKGVPQINFKTTHLPALNGHNRSPTVLGEMPATEVALKLSKHVLGCPWWHSPVGEPRLRQRPSLGSMCPGPASQIQGFADVVNLLQYLPLLHSP